jgi:hypothetical protein
MHAIHANNAIQTIRQILLFDTLPPTQPLSIQPLLFLVSSQVAAEEKGFILLPLRTSAALLVFHIHMRTLTP